MNAFWQAYTIHQNGVMVFLAALLLITVTNQIVLRTLRGWAARETPPAPGQFPRVSILVPARDEEERIAACVTSLAAQDYPDFEILVLDDHSQDRTAEILRDLAHRHPRVKVLSGDPLPPGWLGKHWACHQLAQNAAGSLLLFTDADTLHRPDTLRSAVTVLLARRLEFLSVWPRQVTRTPGEGLLVPLIYWAVFSIFPLALSRLFNRPAFAAAIGQFMLISRRAYDAMGGYTAIRDQSADDLSLVRRVSRMGLRWSFADGTDSIHCRMYTGFKPAFAGLTKNLYAAFNFHSVLFVFVWVWLGIVYLEPLVSLILSRFIPYPADNLSRLFVEIGLAALSWWGIVLRFRFPTVLLLAYPLSMALGVINAFHSMILMTAGRAVWKGRSLPRGRIRL